jgi:hypothetical protein
VEEKEVIAPWKVPEPDHLRHKGPVVQVGHGRLQLPALISAFLLGLPLLLGQRGI